MKWKFVTNFPKSEIKEIYISLEAVNIENYTFCRTATDLFGNVLPDHYALYVSADTTAQEIELFYQANLLVYKKLAETS